MHWADEFKQLLQSLRHPTTGCPWDRKQTWQSLTRFTLEEVYECIDAIDNAEDEHVKEELGDLLFHLFFYAQIATENHGFSIEDIAKDSIRKMRARHPHVFENKVFKNEKEHFEHWEQEKQKEKKNDSFLDDIPKALPACKQTQKIQQRALAAGLSESTPSGTIEQCKVDLDALVALPADKKSAAKAIGKTLFSLIYLCTQYDVDAETLLRTENHNFEKKFRALESDAKQKNAAIKDSGKGLLDINGTP